MPNQISSALRAVIHEEDGGYWTEVPELPGCYTQADSLDELLSNLREAVSLYLKDENIPEEPAPRVDLLELAA